MLIQIERRNHNDTVNITECTRRGFLPMLAVCLVGMKPQTAHSSISHLFNKKRLGVNLNAGLPQQVIEKRALMHTDSPHVCLPLRLGGSIAHPVGSTFINRSTTLGTTSSAWSMSASVV